MVDVRMREHHGVELAQRKGEASVFLRGLLPVALKEAAVESDGAAIDAKEMTGSCYLSRRAHERQLHFSFLLTRRAEIESSAVVRPVTSEPDASRPGFARSADR